MHLRFFPAIAAALLLATVGCSGSSSDDDDAASQTPAGTADLDQDGSNATLDCNDQDASVHPGATETCNNKDDDCNGQIDDGFTTTQYYKDADGDSYGDSSSSTTACTPPTGYVVSSTDCNDASGSVHPGATEITCNGLDEDCSSLKGDHPDSDGDSYDVCAPGITGADGNAVDCDDTNYSVHPNAAEACNSLDDNCNGQADDGVTVVTYYQDVDGDGYGKTEATVTACTPPTGYATQGNDCNDADNTSYPGAPEQSGDGVDSNCNGYADAILTYAGSGTTGGYGGDLGPASEAVMNMPLGVAMDLQGTFYIADTKNNRVRMVTSNGTISSFAGGGGIAGYSGDDGQAYAAQINQPHGVAIDTASNVYIADTLNNRIRKVGFNGIITTVVGDGQTANPNSSTDIGDGGPPTSAHLDFPTGLAFDVAGNMFIADTNHHRIRRVSFPNPKGGQTVTTVAGTGVAGSGGDNGPGIDAQLNAPEGVFVDTGNNVYIADTENHKIRKVSLSGKITTVAGTGVAGYNGDDRSGTSAQLNRPVGLASDLTGAVFVADSKNNRIRQLTLSPQGMNITTLAGNGTAGFSGDGDAASEAELFLPYGLALNPQGNLAITDAGNNRLRVVVW